MAVTPRARFRYRQLVHCFKVNNVYNEHFICKYYLYIQTLMFEHKKSDNFNYNRQSAVAQRKKEFIENYMKSGARI